MTKDQILSVVRIVLTLLGTLSFIKPDLVPVLSELAEQVSGAVLVIIQAVGFIIDELKKGRPSANSNVSVFKRVLLLG